LTAAAWRPLVELTRRRHLAFRRRLGETVEGGGTHGGCVTYPGV
jgi:hypothetical protein